MGLRRWLYGGQDISDRALQFSDKPPQFSLGKSATAFGPTGPALVSLDEFADPDALIVRCWVEGEQMQESTTENLIFSVPRLIEYISSYCTLMPGDLIFTGTPGGSEVCASRGAIWRKAS